LQNLQKNKGGKMLNEKKFNEGMAILCETFQREPTKLLLKAYYMALKDMSEIEFEKAIGNLLQGRKYNTLPMPAEIREAGCGSLDDKALIAYDAFTKGKAQTGAYDTVCFEDKNIHAVIMAMGGWQDVCMVTEEEWKFKRREFLDLYKAISRNSGREIPDKLIGLGEHGCSQNEEWSKHIPDIKMISQFGEIKEVRKQLPGVERNQIESPVLSLVKGIGV
jgi:hypothetical protein